MFRIEVFPGAFKSSKILPLYKEGDTSQPDNYRPILIISIFSKITKKLIKDHLYKYFYKYNFFSKSISERPLYGTGTGCKNSTTMV